MLAVLGRRYKAEIVENVRLEMGLMPAYRITPKERAKASQLHAEGKGATEIGRATGLNRKQIARILEHAGVRKVHRVSASSVLPQILELRSQEKSLVEIGRILGFSAKTIRKALAKREQDTGR